MSVARLVFLLFGLNSCVMVFSETENNIYDTYNPECTRVRRAWHLHSEEERNLFVEGLVELRNHDDFSLDKFMEFADIHTVPYTHAVIHQSSANLFWHGYILWELESRIRDLGGKFSCFSMPYYDTTTDYGRESNPSILDGVGGLGTIGDPEDSNAVKDFANGAMTDKFWIPNENLCTAEEDEYPYCTIKRQGVDESLNGLIIQPATEQMFYFKPGTVYSDYAYFSKIYQWNRPYDPMAFMTELDRELFGTYWGAYQSYEPVWWLFHSFNQYQLGAWIDCHGVLNDPDTGYSSYCGGSHTQLDDIGDCADGTQFSQILADSLGDDYIDNYVKTGKFDFSLDAPLYWVYMSDSPEQYSHLKANQVPVTIRSLWDHAQWNVKYDVGTFFDESGLRDFCDFDDQLTENRWQDLDRFRVAENSDELHKQQSAVMVSNRFDLSLSTTLLIASMSIAIALVVYFKVRGKCSQKGARINLSYGNEYGAIL
jgi:hypothetical protein